VSSVSVSVTFRSFLIYIVVVLRCRRNERPAFVCSLSVLTSFLEGWFQEMVSDLGEFFIFFHNLGLVSNLIYSHSKVPKRREARVCLFPVGVDFFDRRGVAGDDT
jgi:hypothetical protein